MSLIIDDLYLASYDETINFVNNLENDPVQGELCILNVASELDPASASSIRNNNYAKIAIPDDDPKANIQTIIPDAVNFIHKGLSENKTVIVHCWAGMSRSACVVISYLVLYKGLDLDEAISFVKSKRPIVRPFPRYLQQLYAFFKPLEPRHKGHYRNYYSSYTSA